MDKSLELGNISSIFPLNKSKNFTNDEAMNLVPILMHISSRTKKELAILNSQLACLKSQSPKAQEIQEKINHQLQTWSDKMRRLGTTPVGMCKVRIPTEDGQLVWEYPDNKLTQH